MTEIFESRVVRKIELAPQVFLFELERKINFEPGQFAMIGLIDEISVIPKPFSILYSKDESFAILFKVFGDWTARFSKISEKSRVRVFAPCGTGFISAIKRYKLKNPQKILFIAGGLGIASLYPAIDFFSNGKNTLIFGGRTSQDIIIKDMLKNKAEILITTEDGSEGKKGLVTNLIKTAEGVDPDDFDVAMTCGPTPMLKALVKFWKEKNIKAPLLLAMEEKMACGLGICFSCSIKTQNGPKLCCQYGPIFINKELQIF
ncbi:Dihydroorotate dehydrogenase B (NAD(+)), electron transfer subunit [bacterium HR19]|nr:Dihydroorotate dehydrogenase B (NAD(+)), electron transfer subunit [bacterium HR19]